MSKRRGYTAYTYYNHQLGIKIRTYLPVMFRFKEETSVIIWCICIVSIFYSIFPRNSVNSVRDFYICKIKDSWSNIDCGNSTFKFNPIPTCIRMKGVPCTTMMMIKKQSTFIWVFILLKDRLISKPTCIRIMNKLWSPDTCFVQSRL